MLQIWRLINVIVFVNTAVILYVRISLWHDPIYDFAIGRWFLPYCAFSAISCLGLAFVDKKFFYYRLSLAIITALILYSYYKMPTSPDYAPEKDPRLPTMREIFEREAKERGH